MPLKALEKKRKGPIASYPAASLPARRIRFRLLSKYMKGAGFRDEPGSGCKFLRVFSRPAGKLAVVFDL
jgi:hypothetical protein